MQIFVGDCRTVMAEMEPDSVDAIVTDPPYGLGEPRSGGLAGGFRPRSEETKRLRSGGFMGQSWDGTGVAFDPETWAAALRVLKPSGWMVAFGGTRTWHRLACAIEDAGFEVTDTLAWLHGQGFPKGQSCLKPAFEPIVLARKSSRGSVLQIDASRIGTDGESFSVPQSDPANRRGVVGLALQASGGIERNQAAQRASIERTATLGRWPANVLLSHTDECREADCHPDCAVRLLDEQSGERTTHPGVYRNPQGPTNGWGNIGVQKPGYVASLGDTRGVSRFMYTAKADTAERSQGLGGRNTHPTIKPVDLMAWLIKLITPPGGTVLDPFLGSGSTAIAAQGLGFDCIGIEQSAEYVEIARQRIGMFAEVVE